VHQPKEYGWSDLIFITKLPQSWLGHGELVPLHRGAVLHRCTACTIFLRKACAVDPHVSPPGCGGCYWLFLYSERPCGCTLLDTFFQHSPALFAPLYYGSVTHCDGLIIGLIISNLWIAHDKSASRFSTPGILIAVAAALMIGLHQLQKEIFDFTALALLFGSLVWLGLQSPVSALQFKDFLLDLPAILRYVFESRIYVPVDCTCGASPTTIFSAISGRYKSRGRHSDRDVFGCHSACDLLLC